ncbi:glycine cleavage system aminomethyltransferase GcvT [Ktedonobacter robiniae]|uniref:Aminomethyltransferase n=1 Tax=Ktedonobacter robiniae TaxID=2778365 RepID=A0ABQ3UKB7_9CHLR|nr:glycine cleavage system aminomethyltransferase GcvT [Ktedonobacter robiniae]GHO53117.1 aminomethyltransferase [Ktedonobacter robiniae]
MTTQDSAVPSLKRTPLYEQHRALGARLVEFGGWDMPVQYSGIIEEHQAVRTKAGLFDVSHMGEFKAEGSDALAFLQYLVPNDVSRLAVGQALYTQLCRPDGTTIDDLLIYHLAEEQYMLVVNAANIDKDYAWIESHAQKFANVTLSNQSDTTALIALQGPLAMSILQPLADVKLDEIKYYHFAPGQVADIRCLISRTGYTGEDGFELYCPSVDAAKLWQTLLEAGKPQGVLPAGLGARDTLRLEAAYCLYGHELDDETNPLEAGLGWTVKLKKSVEFIGRSALQQAKEQGLKKRLVGIELLERGVPRSGYAIYDGEQRIGVLTSGSHGPTVQKSIGLGFVDPEHAKVGTRVQIEIRGKRVAAQVVALPFYKRGE